jgi:hypothetical protein
MQLRPQVGEEGGNHELGASLLCVDGKRQGKKLLEESGQERAGRGLGHVPEEVRDLDQGQLKAVQNLAKGEIAEGHGTASVLGFWENCTPIVSLRLGLVLGFRYTCLTGDRTGQSTVAE